MAYVDQLTFFNAKYNVSKMLGLSPYQAEQWLDVLTNSSLQLFAPGLGHKTTDEGLRRIQSISGTVHAYTLIKAYDIQLREQGLIPWAI